MQAAFCGRHATTAFCCMANSKRVRAFLEMASEDLAAAQALLTISTRIARYHVQQGAEKAVKALLEQRGVNPGREHRFGVLAGMFAADDPWRQRISELDFLSPAATSHRYPTAEGRVLSPPRRELVESDIAAVLRLIEDVKRVIESTT